MAYNTKAILRDLNGNPIPQYYDPADDVYKPLNGDYVWLSTDTAPTLSATARDFGAEINVVTNEIVVKYWNGTAWELVV